jgi:regulator of replication initiation timing
MERSAIAQLIAENEALKSENQKLRFYNEESLKEIAKLNSMLAALLSKIQSGGFQHQSTS